MFQFIESIRWENGVFHQLDYHINRMNKTVNGSGDLLEDQLTKQLIENLSNIPLAKIRIIYGEKIEITWAAYQRKIIGSLKIIHHNTIDYSLKSTDRNELINLYKKRGDFDDILIIKNELITDTYYHNIIFYNGIKWITPSQPLLEGTQRQFLLDQGIINSEQIKLVDLSKFQAFKLINALNPFETSPVGLIKNIK